MRTSLARADKVERISFGIMAAGLASAAIFVVGAVIVGGSDAAIDRASGDRSGVSADIRSIPVPAGTIYARAEDGSAAIEVAPVMVSVAQADASTSGYLNDNGHRVAGMRQRVNRSMKGDRVFSVDPAPKQQQVAQANQKLFETWSLLAEGDAQFKARPVLPSQEFTIPRAEVAAAFDPASEVTSNDQAESKPLALASLKPKEAPVVQIDKEAMFEQARAAARVLAKRQASLAKAFGRWSEIDLDGLCPSGSRHVAGI